MAVLNGACLVLGFSWVFPVTVIFFTFSVFYRPDALPAALDAVGRAAGRASGM